MPAAEIDRVLATGNRVLARAAASALEAAGIAVQIVGDHLEGAYGSLGAGSHHVVELWVDRTQVPQAEAILAQLEAGAEQLPPDSPDTCTSGAGQPVEGDQHASPHPVAKPPPAGEPPAGVQSAFRLALATITLLAIGASLVHMQRAETPGFALAAAIVFWTVLVIVLVNASRRSRRHFRQGAASSEDV